MLVTVNKGHFLPREEDVRALHEPVYLRRRRSSDASRVLEVSALAASSFFFFFVICSFTFPKVQVVLRHSPPHRTLRLRCSHDPVWPAREAPARPRPPSTRLLCRPHGATRRSPIRVLSHPLLPRIHSARRHTSLEVASTSPPACTAPRPRPVPRRWPHMAATPAFPRCALTPASPAGL